MPEHTPETSTTVRLPDAPDRKSPPLAVIDLADDDAGHEVPITIRHPLGHPLPQGPQGDADGHPAAWRGVEGGGGRGRWRLPWAVERSSVTGSWVPDRGGGRSGGVVVRFTGRGLSSAVGGKVADTASKWWLLFIARDSASPEHLLRRTRAELRVCLGEWVLRSSNGDQRANFSSSSTLAS